MGFFDLFKKKKTTENTSVQETNPTNENISTPQQQVPNNNVFLLEILKDALETNGYKVEKHTQYQAIIINSEIEIATAIIENPNYHPSLIHLMILTIHPKYFPEGIEENIVGMGNTIEEKVQSVLHNYLTTTFEPIIDSLTDSHNPELDFEVNNITWHPKLGNMALQGDWSDITIPENEVFFHLLEDKIIQKLTNNKLNWLKIYISKSNDKIEGECLLNNECWKEGLQILTNYIQNVETLSDFIGIKQFIMFRKCDASE
ncbi:DUF6348 family protein [Chryseobacterium sp. G0201]|uniref:DUF6348 family protein n=1 Tax=Chryseobacterium sp. G0201 TaxID=2487065 RepID=UPI000F4F978F|nr:DUF6348 family protein [Chryseobacterium sp. G0201]AZA51774.1 hypothetical protein EG348_01470 [Chryseobacterium sp. G0201]